MIVEKGQFKSENNPFSKKDSNASSITPKSILGFTGGQKKNSLLIYKGEVNPNIELTSKYFGEVKEGDTIESI